MKDKEIKELISLEKERQNESLNLIASENLVSQEIRDVIGSILTNKYSEGYPGKRYYPGNKIYDEIEIITQKRALKLFSLDENKWSVNVQPYSGSPANLAILLALAKQGETIMGMSLNAGGHLTHGHNVSASGRIWNAVQFGVDEKTGCIDFEELEELAKKEKPRVIISGFTAYPRKVSFEKFDKIAKSVGAYHVADISHIAGLVAGGVHASPFPHADVVMTTTHKSLRGPRGAIIFSQKNLSDDIDKAVFPGVQGGPHNNVIGAKAVAFQEAMAEEFKAYAKQIVENSGILADELIKQGCTLIGGGTDTHLILLDVRNFDIDGKEAEERLEGVGIIANRNSIPGDTSPLKPSGLRLGTPALTTRGMKEDEMQEIAGLICDALKKSPGVAEKVKSLCKKFPIQ